MQFCPKCGSLLLPKEGGKKANLVCGKCNYRSREKKNIILKEKVSLERADKIEVIDQKIETLPKVKTECKKCGHKSAYFWLLQTRSSDEAETKFFECVKCSHRWREYT